MENTNTTDEPNELENLMVTLAALMLAAMQEVQVVAAEALENESLAQEYPDGEVMPTNAERWVDARGNMGWRVYVRGYQLAPRHAMALQSKLRDRGWEAAEVVAV